MSNLKNILRIIFILLLFCSFSKGFCAQSPIDSIKHVPTILDSLSAEDLELLNQYKDSFENELKDIKSVFFKLHKYKRIDTTVYKMNTSSHFELGLDFTSRILANGRSSSIDGVGLYPSIMYYHKTGLYANLTMCFFTDSFVRASAAVPVVVFSPGFYRQFFHRWTFSLGYSHSFNLFGPPIFRPVLNNTFSLYNSFDFWRIIDIGLNLQFSFTGNRKVIYEKYGQKYAGGIGITLKHDFSFFHFIGAKVFTITPQLNMQFGNDNSVYVLRGIRKNKQVLPFNTDRFFGFLDIEPGVMVDWRIKNLDIYASFQVAIPFNEFDDTAKKRVSNPHEYYPYANAGIKYLFRIKLKKKS